MKKDPYGLSLSKVLVASLLTFVPLFAGRFNAVVDIGDPLPEFTGLPATDGSKLSSGDIKEDVLVLVFLANHCPWVKGGDGDLIELVDEMKQHSVRVVGVSVNHREEDRLPAMKEHAATVGYNFTYVYDESQELGRALGAARTPEYFVFDKARKLVYMGLFHDSPAMMRRDGTVQYTKGDPTEFHVKNAVEAVLSGKTPSVGETRAQGCNVEYAR
jgi:peroxiredoxin